MSQIPFNGPVAIHLAQSTKATGQRCCTPGLICRILAPELLCACSPQPCFRFSSQTHVPGVWLQGREPTHEGGSASANDKEGKNRTSCGTPNPSICSILYWFCLRHSCEAKGSGPPKARLTSCSEACANTTTSYHPSIRSWMASVAGHP